jgi:hypothetical protein
MLYKIYSHEEEQDRLLAPIKPRLKVKRLDFRPTEEREKEKAEKALLFAIEQRLMNDQT